MNILILHSCVCNGQDVNPGRVLFDVPEHEAAVVIGAGYAQKVEDALPEPEDPFEREPEKDVFEKQDDVFAETAEETPETLIPATKDVDVPVDTTKKKNPAKTARKTKKK